MASVNEVVTMEHSCEEIPQNLAARRKQKEVLTPNSPCAKAGEARETGNKFNKIGKKKKQGKREKVGHKVEAKERQKRRGGGSVRQEKEGH